MTLKIHLNIVLLGICVFLCWKVAAQNDQCQFNCKHLAHFDCAVCYNSCPQANSTLTSSNISSDSTFQMKSCKQTYCAYWATSTYYNGKYTTTTTYCARYDQRDLNEQDCIGSCCNNPSYSLFTNSTFNQCVIENQSLQKQKNLIAMIIGITLASIFLICCGAILCCYLQVCSKIKICCSKVSCFPCLRTNDQVNQSNGQVLNVQNNLAENSIKMDSIESKSKTIIALSPTQNFIWSQIENKVNRSLSECCTICLDSNINCQTACGHSFHFICFKSWIQKNPTCPLCITTQYNNVKIFCQSCNMKQISQYIAPNYEGKQSFMTGNKVFCDRCRDSKNYEISSCLLLIEERK